MKIGLDFDGVVADCAKLKAHVFHDIYGLDVSPAVLMSGFIGEGGKLFTSWVKYRKFQEEVFCQHKYLPDLKPVRDAGRFITSLRGGGHFIKVITSRDQGVAADLAQEWLVCQGIVVDDFVSVGQNGDKRSAVAGLDIVVDDDFWELIMLSGIVPRLCLFSWDYNCDIKEGLGASVRRVRSWLELYHIIVSGMRGVDGYPC